MLPISFTRSSVLEISAPRLLMAFQDRPSLPTHATRRGMHRKRLKCKLQCSPQQLNNPVTRSLIHVIHARSVHVHYYITPNITAMTVMTRFVKAKSVNGWFSWFLIIIAGPYGVNGARVPPFGIVTPPGPLEASYYGKQPPPYWRV